MLLHSMRSMVVLVGSIAVANAALAADDSKSEGRVMKIAAGDATFGGQFRTEWSHTTNGLGKVDEGGKDKKTAGFGVDYAKLKLTGKLNSDTEFAFQMNLLSHKWNYGNPADMIERANGTWWMSKMFGFTMGKERVNQDGWDGKDSGNFDAAWGKSVWTTPFKTYANMFAIHLNPGDMGKITLQLVDDLTTVSGPDFAGAADGKTGRNTTNRPATWNETNKQPAPVLQYTGEFGPVKPLLQIGQYDMNHSRFIDVGAKFSMADLGVTFDYLMDNYSQKVAKSSGDGYEDKMLTYTNIALRADYTMKGLAKPFVWVSSFNRSGEKEAIAADDVKANQNPSTNTKCAAFKACFDDNAMSLSVGSYILAMGDGWSPYVVYRSVSGKFYKAGSTDEATGSTSTIAIGAAGAF